MITYTTKEAKIDPRPPIRLHLISSGKIKKLKGEKNKKRPN